MAKIICAVNQYLAVFHDAQPAASPYYLSKASSTQQLVAKPHVHKAAHVAKPHTTKSHGCPHRRLRQSRTCTKLHVQQSCMQQSCPHRRLRQSCMCNKAARCDFVASACVDSVACGFAAHVALLQALCGRGLKLPLTSLDRRTSFLWQRGQMVSWPEHKADLNIRSALTGTKGPTGCVLIFDLDLQSQASCNNDSYILDKQSEPIALPASLTRLVLVQIHYYEELKLYIFKRHIHRCQA